MTLDDAWWCLMTLNDAWWCLIMLDDAWWHLMMLDDTWWHLMMLDDTWWHLMTLDDTWWHLMTLDFWCSITVHDSPSSQITTVSHFQLVFGTPCSLGGINPEYTTRLLRGGWRGWPQPRCWYDGDCWCCPSLSHFNWTFHNFWLISNFCNCSPPAQDTFPDQLTH